MLIFRHGMLESDVLESENERNFLISIRNNARFDDELNLAVTRCEDFLEPLKCTNSLLRKLIRQMDYESGIIDGCSDICAVVFSRVLSFVKCDILPKIDRYAIKKRDECLLDGYVKLLHLLAPHLMYARNVVEPEFKERDRRNAGIPLLAPWANSELDRIAGYLDLYPL